MHRLIRAFLINNTLILATFVLGLGFAFVAPAAYATPLLTNATQHLSLARIHIPGMTCANKSCSTTVYIALIRLPGVMGVGVNEATQVVSVRYNARTIKPKAFLKAVRNAGYPGTLMAPNRS